MIKPKISSLSHLRYEFVLFLLIFLIGFLWRITAWNSWPAIQVEGSNISLPLLGNSDGYFYLGLARDLVEGSYYGSPWLRVFPEHIVRPEPAPLLASLTSVLVSVTGLPLEVLATFIPAILGSCILFPIVMIGKEMDGKLLAVVAGLFSVLIPYYVDRTSFGWYDTDSLVVTLPLMISAVTLVLMSQTTDLKVQAAGILVLAFLIATFFWWWDQAPQVVVFLSIYPLIVMLAFRWSHQVLRYLAFILILFVIWLSPVSLMELAPKMLGVFDYVFEKSDGIFSPTAIAIGEQRKPAFREAVRLVSANLVMLLVAFFGFLYLSIRRPVIGLLLIPFLVIGTLGFFAAQRFLIFLAPIIAIGIGGSLVFVYSQINRALALPLIVMVCLTFSAALMLARSDNAISEPIIPLTVVEPAYRLSQDLPQDAILWNLCDYGYALSYWSRRATVCDGSSHSSALRTYTAFPLFADTELQTSRFIHFYLRHGYQGMKQILQRFDNHWLDARDFLRTIFNMSPMDAHAWLLQQWQNLPSEEIDDWIDFLFPKPIRPVYLVLDRQTMRNTHWWYWFSTWDSNEKKGIHPYYILFPYLPDIQDKGQIIGPDHLFSIDLEKGIVQFRNEDIDLRYLNWIKDGKFYQIEYSHSGHMIMDIVVSDRYAVLHDPLTHSKVGHILYSQITNSPIFEPVLISGAEFQVWRVHHPDEIQSKPE